MRNYNISGAGAGRRRQRAGRNGTNILIKKINVDLIIVGRGGGSIEELWVFNEERTARAIANSKIPIISAVGHETDLLLLILLPTFVPTPSAAAELAVPSVDELKSRIKRYYSTMVITLSKTLENSRNILKRFALKSPMDVINQHMQRLDILQKDLFDIINNKLQENRSQLALQAGRLDALSPLGVLKRGYGIVHDDGRLSDQFRKNIGYKYIQLLDGTKSVIKEIEHE